MTAAVKKELLIAGAAAGVLYCIHRKKSGIHGIGAIRHFNWEGRTKRLAQYGDGEYGEQAREFAEKNGVKLYVVDTAYGRYFPDDDRLRHIFKMELERDGERYIFTFGQSIAAGAKDPTYYDVLASLTKNDPGTFEDFCADFGYDDYSKNSYKIYKAVCDEYENVERLFGDIMDELQEIW